ncbi:alpha/beta hydrolase [Nocardia fluminea]|uniref:alpha/beta hydrolase n=1 Tax=Nocardia fluminea TaxID=134984 RepID=UPI00366A75CD
MTRQDVLLIHGTWCNGENWGEFAKELESRGFVVHAPSLRHHAAPRQGQSQADAQRVGKVGLLDFVADLEQLVATMSTPPIVIGHSLGALYAQLLAARVPTSGVVLLGPAPAAGIHALYPSMIRLWGRYLPQWLAGKPMYPVSWTPWEQLICNRQPPEIQQSYYRSLCAESGTAYRQMALWFLDPKKSARVDFSAVRAPVLVVTGSKDRCTMPQIGRTTAKRYGQRGTYVELDGSDHMMTIGQYLPTTLAAIDTWLNTHSLVPEQA